MTYMAGLPANLLLSGINLTLSASSWIYVLVAIVAVGASFLVYRYTLPPVSNLRRSILWSLRGAALLLILLMLFEPVLVYLLHRQELPAVAVLIDKSASMTVKDGSIERSALVREMLSSSSLKRLGDRAKVHYYSFSDSTSELQNTALREMSFDGVGTDPSTAIIKAEDALSGNNLAAIMIVSDGNQNLGSNPVRVAKESSVPIYTFGVGDTSRKMDIAITEMLTNQMIYVGSRVPVDVRIHAHGVRGKTSTLHLVAGGKEVSRQVLSFNDDDGEQSVTTSFLAEVTGDLRVKTIIDSIPGETIVENNSRSVIVRVLEAKAKVLVFSGPPSADLTSLRQTLESDTTYETQVFVEAGAGKLLGGKAIPTDDVLEKSSLFVLVNMPSRTTPQDLISRITRIADLKHIPVLYFMGPDVQQTRFEWLSSLLPIQMVKQNTTEMRVTLRASANHPAITGRAPLPAEWSELPPTLGTIGGFTTAASAVTAVKLSRESLGVNEDEPGIVFWQRSQMRGAAFLCWGIHRWKLELASSGNGSGFYDDLISRVSAWLIAPANQQQVRIQTSKKLYSGGEHVRFLAQVYGSDLTPRDDATIDLHVKSGERSEVVPMRNRGNGRYEGEFAPWSEGDYKFSGTAAVGSDTLGRDQGLFALEAFNIELVDPRARLDVLQQIASASSGAYVSIQSADSLLGKLQFTPKPVTTRKEIPLWNRAGMLWVIIGLLCAEWILRKRSGML